MFSHQESWFFSVVPATGKNWVIRFSAWKMGQGLAQIRSPGTKDRKAIPGCRGGRVGKDRRVGEAQQLKKHFKRRMRRKWVKPLSLIMSTEKTKELTAGWTLTADNRMSHNYGDKGHPQGRNPEDHTDPSTWISASLCLQIPFSLEKGRGGNFKNWYRSFNQRRHFI